MDRGSMSWIVLLALGLGCGGGDGSAGGLFPATDRSGTGSNTLNVEARIEASPLGDEHAASAADLATDFEIDVRDASGADVVGATVIVDSPLGAVTLTEGGCTRRYCGGQNGYADVYEISVARGSDFLDDVVIHGPSLHDILAPEQGATVDASAPVLVRWSPSGDADTVRFETRELQTDLAEDAGSFEVPAGTLRTRDDRPEDERVRVRRERRLALTGSIDSSTAVVGVRNGVEFVTAVTP